MQDTETNRQRVIEELTKFKALSQFFGIDAAAPYVPIIIKHYPDIGTLRGVMADLLETLTRDHEGRLRIPTPAEFISLRDAYIAKRRECGDYCSACDDTGYRVEAHVMHTMHGPHQFDVAVRCRCGGFGDRPACRTCNDQGWVRQNGKPTVCDCGRGANFDVEYQALPLKNRLRADGVDEDLIATLDIPRSKKSEMRELLLAINSEKYVRRYQGDAAQQRIQQGAA